MTTVKSDRDAKSKPPAQLLAKQVKFVVNLESSSENAGCTENLDLKAKEFPVKQGIGAVSGKVKIESGDAMDIEGVLDTENMLVRPDGQGNSCMAEPNGQDQEDQEEGRGGIMGDGQDFSEEDESRDNGVVGDVINGDWPPREASLRPQGLVLQQQQPQAQGPIIRWERFLAQRCLKVLLVENDDSTRQVVSALLRNCSYEVTAIANGLQAWKLLEDPSNHFDLVLTEVVMPCLSGIGLLCKIMAHKTCKNIPVIMMSSHDSMGIVFKCLSKGAVDFLVKPVRKNELKNLWQHVWRRCHSSSGSGSETGSQTQKILMPRSEDDSDNNTGSNDESDDASISLNVRDGSDNGSGTQSSWTKRAVEVESPRQRSEWEPSQPLSSTIAQVIQPKMETIQNDWIPLAGTSGECQDEKPYDSEMGQDLEIAVPRQKGTELKCHQEEKALCSQACAGEENAPLANSGEGNQIHEGPARTSGSPSGEAASKAVDLIGAIASKPKVGDLELENNESREILEKGMNSSQMKDKTTSDFKYLPFLELTLKRPRQSGDEDGEPEDRHVLRQSGGSAFSRYNTSGAHVSHPSGTSFPPNVYSLPNGHRGHSCVPSGSLGSGKTGSLRVTIPIERVGSSKGSGGDASTPGTMHQLSHGSNNQDLGSVVCPSGQERFPRAAPIKDETLSASNVGPQLGKPMSRHCGVIPYDAVPSAYGSAIHPMYYSHTGAPLWGPETQHVKERGDVCDNSAQNEQQLPRPRTLQNQVQHHHHHHHIQHVHHHHHHHQSHQHKHLHEHPKQEEQTINNVAVTAPRCGSSNMVGNAPDGNTCQSGSNNGYGSNGNGNGSVNGSASGSNNGSNGLNGHSNGQSSAAVTPGTNGESDTGIGMKSSAGGGSGSGVDQNRVAQREAALTKFRQKRKERCFEKKVRYQSRKRLAEQRPRVRGQFVRQPMHEPTNDEAE